MTCIKTIADDPCGKTFTIEKPIATKYYLAVSSLESLPTFTISSSCGEIDPNQAAPGVPAVVATHPEGELGAQALVTVTSDGTRSRPYCSWASSCTWSPYVQQLCAEKLCQASGYTTGTWIADTGSMCQYSVTGDTIWAYVVDWDTYYQAGFGLESRITAQCGTPDPSPSPSPECFCAPMNGPCADDVETTKARGWFDVVLGECHNPANVADQINAYGLTIGKIYNCQVSTLDNCNNIKCDAFVDPDAYKSLVCH
jgi:hypothetical protein